MKRFILNILTISILFSFIGCSSNTSSSDNAMSLSYDNLMLFVNKQEQANNSKALGMSKKENFNYLYTDVMNDMGYSYEATLLASVKVLANTKTMSKTYYLLDKLFNPIIPVLAKSDGFISNETRNKLAFFVKFRYIKPNFIEGLKLVKKCQDTYNNICTKTNFLKILSEHDFIDTQELIKRAEDTENYMRGSASMVFIRKIGDSDNLPKFDKYIISKNGSKKGIMNFFDKGDNASIRLTDSASEEMSTYNPWWLK